MRWGDLCSQITCLWFGPRWIAKSVSRIRQRKNTLQRSYNKYDYFNYFPLLTWRLRLTTPSGSTSSRCLGRPQCMPVSTYCPGLVVLSRTRKSPSRTRSLSASRLLIRLWYHGSLRSCSSFGATGARRRGGLGHWSSRTWTPPAAADTPDPTAPPQASWSFRASSKGPTETSFTNTSVVTRPQYFQIQKVSLSLLYQSECVPLTLKTYSCQRGPSWDCRVPWPLCILQDPRNSDSPRSGCWHTDAPRNLCCLVADRLHTGTHLMSDLRKTKSSQYTYIYISIFPSCAWALS